MHRFLLTLGAGSATWKIKFGELNREANIVNYALIGAAGYISPRHLKAMRDTGGRLAVAYDPNDSVGILDSYFPKASFCTNFERFESHVHALKRIDEPIDYVTICSPNHLHKLHAGFALRSGADAICEKPLVLDPSELDELDILEKETGQKINTILQLRLHPAILALKQRVDAQPDRVWDVDLGYFTARGAWYHSSWKGDEGRSGGIASNIGIHFYDMLSFVFGKNMSNVVHYRGRDAAAGYLEFQNARVRWVLSINSSHLPVHTPAGQTTHRSITINGTEIEFSGGFTDLHTASYSNILNQKGYGLQDARPSIEIVHRIRTGPIELSKGEQHPDISRVIAR